MNIKSSSNPSSGLQLNNLYIFKYYFRKFLTILSKILIQCKFDMTMNKTWNFKMTLWIIWITRWNCSAGAEQRVATIKFVVEVSLLFLYFLYVSFHYGYNSIQIASNCRIPILLSWTFCMCTTKDIRMVQV